MKPINLQPGHLTNVFNQLQQSGQRFVICFGGTGSGKSYAAAQKEILKAVRYPNVKTLVIRKVGTNLRDSVIPSFRSRIEEMGLNAQFRYNKTERTITNTNTQSQIIFRGLDDPEKLKSFEGLQRVLVEEASELAFEDFTELNRRVRGHDDIQLTLCFNPIHEQHWLKKHFFDTEQADRIIIHSTYKDNQHLTDKDREQIEWMRKYDHNQYRVYALGEWGLMQNRNPWLYAFDREKHVAASISYDNRFPVYLSFDFNLDPLSCVAMQMSPHRGHPDSFIHIIREFSGSMGMQEMCTRIRTAFPGALLHVTGDASGNRSDLAFEAKNNTYYHQLKNYLGINDRLLHLNSRNLQHNDSRLLLNSLFESYPRLLLSGEHCPLLINDCIIAVTDEQSLRPGTLRKDRNIYKMDLFDAMRYFFQTYFIDYTPHRLKMAG